MSWATVRRAVLALLGATALAALPPTAPATAVPGRAAQGTPTDTILPGQPALLIVLDISTSMEEDDGAGTMKLAGAKRAIGLLLGELTSEVRIGLNTYPTDAECSPGASPFPIAAANRTDMDRYVRGIGAAQGGTPTAAALRKAGADLQAAGEQRAVVVLVSDGESNCGEAPCEAAEELASLGIDITVNTVGFNISDAGRNELTCIAEATGGSYVDVADADGLSDRISSEYVPDLDLAVEFDDEVALRAGADNRVDVTATITNTGRVLAPDVEATITYDAGLSPGQSKPRRRVGNIPPGDSTQVTWSIRPTDEFADRTVSFTVRAFTRGAEAPERKGTIRFRRDLQVEDLPSWLTGADHVVVLGDSYSSGEGVAGTRNRADFTYDPPTDTAYNSCHRANAANVGGRLVELLDLGQQATTLACSGALAADFWTDSKTRGTDKGSSDYHRADGKRKGTPLPSQLDQLRALDGHADLVLLTIGGNDARFSTLVLRCLLLTDCAQTSLPWLGGSGLEVLGASLAPLGARLETVYRSTQRVASEEAGRDVPVLVLAYPLPFPSPGQPCSVAGRRFSPQNRKFLNDLAARTNRVARAAADRVRAQGRPVWFVETTGTTMLNGHTYCDPVPWINALSLETAEELIDNVDGNVGNTLTGTQWLAALASLKNPEAARAYKNLFHPTEAGYRAEAELVAAWAGDHPDLRVDAPKAGEEVTTAPLRTRSVASGRTITVPGAGATAVRPGETFAAAAAGFAPGSAVEVTLASDPEWVASATVDPDGSVRASVTIRPDFPTGAHELVLTGLDPHGATRELRQPLDVRPGPPGWWMAALIGAGALALATAVLTGWSLRRRLRTRQQRPVRRLRPRRPAMPTA